MVVAHQTVADIGQGSATHTDGMDLQDLIGNGTETRYRTERLPFVVHVKTGDNNTDTFVGELVADLYEAIVEELRFVDTHHVDIFRQK